MQDFQLVEMSEETLHEVVGAVQSIRCEKGQGVTIYHNPDGSSTVTCD